MTDDACHIKYFAECEMADEMITDELGLKFILSVISSQFNCHEITIV